MKSEGLKKRRRKKKAETGNVKKKVQTDKQTDRQTDRKLRKRVRNCPEWSNSKNGKKVLFSLADNHTSSSVCDVIQSEEKKLIIRKLKQASSHKQNL